MKRFYIVIILLLAMAGLNSCIGKAQYYMHKPTHAFRFNMSESGFRMLKEFSDNDIVFVPDFVEMTPDYPAPRSFLAFYSQTMTSIYVDKAILYSGSRTYKKELVVNKEVIINEKFKSFFTGDIFLFGDDINGLDKIWNEDFAILEVYYRIPKEGNEGQLKKMEFKLELKTSVDIAWST